MKTRIYFLDHIRTFAIFLVVLVHAGIVYEQVLENIWIVSDPSKNSSIGLVRMYLDLFVMYTIFFISGYFIPISIKRKSTLDFLKSKFKRILLPWILAVFTLIPAYKIIFLYSRGLPQEAWYSYFHIFQRTGSDLAIFSNNPSQNWLWFLPILWLFQLLYLGISKMNLFPAKITLKTAVGLTFLFGVIYSMIISNAGLTGWFHSGFFEFQRERLLPYFLVFLLGSLCYKLNVFESRKNKQYYVIANVVLTLSISVFTVVALNLFFNLVSPERNYFFISGPLDRMVYYITALLSMFSFLYVLIHVFRFNFNKTNRLMDQLNKYSYAVYIIHVVVLGVLAWLMVPIPIPVLVKYILLTLLTFVLSNVLVYAYDRLIQKRVILKAAIASLLVVGFFVITSSRDQEVQAINSYSQFFPPKTGLHQAVIQGNVEAIAQHIKAGSDLDEKEASGGASPLITAAAFGKTAIALLLIEGGADLDFQNNEGSTALHTAAFFCNIKIVEALLTNGADRDIKNKAGSTALESMTTSFEELKDVYEYFQNSLGPLGLKLDYEQIKRDRPRIAELLRQ